ncbi:MAG: cupin domain-containing protein [Myxococcales bacterium]|nr:cupin domain-containing protein [Myxococcales bacterium]
MSHEKKAPDAHVVNVADAVEEEGFDGEHWGHAWKVLTPSMGKGRLGVNQTRVPPGRVAVPFHAHQREDEVFFVLSGRGVLRYGDTLREIRAGDCVSCPARSGVAHQIANPFDEDLVYLSIGLNDPDEVCTYPDSGKVLVRSLKLIGRFERTEYMDGEPARPKLLELIEASELRSPRS